MEKTMEHEMDSDIIYRATGLTPNLHNPNYLVLWELWHPGTSMK